MDNPKTVNNEELVQAQAEIISDLQKDIESLRTELHEGKNTVDKEAIDREIELLYDPYDSQRPYKIIGEIAPDNEYPEGQVLRWLSPRFREVRGMRGWVALQYGDTYTGKNGELLKKYIPDPPARMVGSDKLDSYVRRADLILGRLDKRIWQSRRLKAILESARRRGSLESDKPIKIRDGVWLTGEGLKKDENPKQGLRPRNKDAKPDGVHRHELFKEKENESKE